MELEIFFGGVLATRSENWSFGGVIAFGPEESSIQSSSMSRKTPINVDEDENLLRNTHEEAQVSKKNIRKEKQKSKLEKMSRIMNALKKFEGPSTK